MISWNFVSDNWLSLLNSFIILVGIPAFNAWRNHKWTKKLETYKATLNKEMEEYKTNLNLCYYRKSSFSKKQLDILEDLWERFVEVCYVSYEIININAEYNQVYKMNKEQFIDFIENKYDIGKLDESIFNGVYGKDIFIKEMMNKQINEIIKKIEYFVRCLDKKAIFITPEIKDKFNNVQEILRIAMEIYRQNVEGIKK